MTTWRYIKGSEKDFEGYSDGVLVIRKRQDNHIKFGSDGQPANTDWLSDIIAQRERVTSINDDRLAQDMGVSTLITERGTRYGKFKDGAEIMRGLKHVMHEVDGWNNLTPSQKESLDMIQHKIGRILNGDPTYDDSWKDIAGYAMLIVEELNGVSK
jgi:hypothetical protein